MPKPSIVRAGGLTLIAVVGGSTASAHLQDATVRTVLTERLPNPARDTLAARILEVRYGPGDSSTVHRHPCPVLVYVVSGALRSATEDLPERVYRKGETFFEAANRAHLVSANASDRDSVLFTATFLCDAGSPGAGR